jgi:hypothetical protein
MSTKNGSSEVKKIVLTQTKAMADELFSQMDHSSWIKAGVTKRSPTLLKLEWLSERLRRADNIKEQLQANTYSVDSKAVARKMLNLDS